jgi:hypothetical protein
MLRAGSSIGEPSGRFRAASASLVPLPSAVAKRGISAYVVPAVASSVWMRKY